MQQREGEKRFGRYDFGPRGGEKKKRGKGREKMFCKPCGIIVRRGCLTQNGRQVKGDKRRVKGIPPKAISPTFPARVPPDCCVHSRPCHYTEGGKGNKRGPAHPSCSFTYDPGDRHAHLRNAERRLKRKASEKRKRRKRRKKPPSAPLWHDLARPSSSACAYERGQVLFSDRSRVT